MIITMVGRLSECVLLAYRTPAESVRRLVARGLELVVREDWAFWNIVACRIDGMRPAGLPEILGMSYHHIAYRLYVRARTADGRIIDGIQFIRSDADNNLLAQFGNMTTDFKFNRAGVSLKTTKDAVTLDVRDTTDAAGDARLILDMHKQAELDPESCFDS